MKMHLLICGLMLSLLNCENQTSTPQKQDNKVDSAATYLALGDSYTIGQNVQESERWPVLLANVLKEADKPVQKPYFIARTGWTTRDLLNGIQNYHPEKPYDLVSLLIGVNNQYQGRSIEEFKSEFAQLLVKSISYAGGDANHVFVLSIPDWGMTPFGESVRESTSKEIDQFNQVAKSECDKAKVVFVDITGISRKALNDPSMLADDNLHYSGKMHQLWANEALLAVRTKI